MGSGTSRPITGSWSRGFAWPNLSPADVSNLVAYLNSRDPAR